MLETLARNNSYRNSNVRLYELAKVYRPCNDTLPDERTIITLGAYGKIDFFSLKGCVEALLRELRVKDICFTADSENQSYHPGRCAVIKSGGAILGSMGQIHPAVAKNYDLGETYAAEIDFMSLLACRAPESLYTPLPRFPSTSRDIALVCDTSVTVAALTDCIKRGGGALLKEVELFDIYTGSQVPQGKKSVAFSLKLRADDMTLTDEHADETTKSILVLLEKELGAVIR
jgi:phenylalanyl-tRNA synthetase beta chain